MELGDIDLDLCPSKRPKILNEIKKERGQNFNKDIDDLSRKNLGCTLIATFGTEGTRSTILTACRGYRSEEYPEGIDVDTAQYLSSLVPVERGFVWSFNDIYYGNPEKGRKPVKLFINEVNLYPGLFDIMLGIEGLISRRGRHASGIILFDEDPYEYCCFMKTPSGEIVTQYDLHDAEAAGMTKMDVLVTEIQDKIVQTIKFLQDRNEIDPSLPLRDAYNKYLHPDVLPLEDKLTWKTIQEASSLDLFQLDSDIGRQGAKKVKPSNMLELSATNGLIRLMTTEKGKESWLDKYIRFKNNEQELYKEYKSYKLTDEEIKYFERYLKETYGIGISQEQFMKVLMDEDLCGFSLKDANSARKVISKKKMNEIPVLKEKIFATAKNKNIANYIWDYVAGPGMGYSFSDIHSTSYSFIGFQSAYLATHWNPIYWNTACLVVNSGSLEEEEPEIVSIYEKENSEDYKYEDLPDRSGKKKEKMTDYAKVAKAIGNTIDKGIKVSLVDINKSNYSFEPDIENNEILFGMKALSNINGAAIEQIIAGRPYTGIKDFMLRCPLNKSAMFSLIKAGAFDKLEAEWGEELGIPARKAVMIYYISKVCEPKKKITLQNFNGLIEKSLIPENLDFEKKAFLFNKYLKTKKQGTTYYLFDEVCESFYSKFFDIDQLEIINGITCIKQKTWDNIYKKVMDKVREWVQTYQDDILNNYNTILFEECWNKYALGNLSSYEMDALCFYYHEHELAHVNVNKYGVVDFNKLSADPEIDYFFKRNNQDIPIYKINKIIGTVIGKNDTRSSISLLTTTGVVNVKFTKEYYSMYQRQISELGEDGVKHVIEKGWFARGKKLLVAGFRRDDSFVAKTYSKTGFHQLYLITEIKDNGDIELKHEREGMESD